MSARERLRRAIARADIDPEPVGASAVGGDASGADESGNDSGPDTGRGGTGHALAVGGVEIAYRRVALAGVALLTLSYVSVLYGVTDVVGASRAMAALVVGTVIVATLLARAVRPRVAVGLAALLLAVGAAAYLLSIPRAQLATVSPGTVAADTLALLTGLSVLRLLSAHVWALAIAPAPVFLSWYLAVRGRYAAGALVGSLPLGLVVLTGDAGTAATLAGALGALTALGFDILDRYGATAAQFDAVTATMAAIVVLSATVTVVPGGSGAIAPGDGGTTVEANVVDDDGRVPILGSIQLSPEVRFAVESTEPAYWRTGAYDRYTGDGWLRTGESEPYEGELAGPPGEDRVIRQRVTARSSMEALPAAWKPVRLDGAVADGAEVTEQGSLRPGGTIAEGDRYAVRSRAPVHTEASLREAGTSYPAGIERRYTQLPDSTPERVERRAEEVAGDEPTPYDKAVAVERYLEANKNYSLDVQRPPGEVADAFLFQMEAGYCTYFATTMVTLLRAEGVPARFATGYTTGERVDDDEWVVRGLNAHAWVEVYFPDTGWVAFDPTPGDARIDAREERIRAARAEGDESVDTNRTAPEEIESTPDGNFSGNTSATDPDLGDEDAAFEERPAEDDGVLPTLPSRRTLGLGLIAFVGLAAGARRAGAVRGARRRVRLYYQRRRDPETDVRRAYERIEWVLARDYRPRRPGETPRAYLSSLPAPDGRELAVGRLYERARYGEGVTAAEAAVAVEHANALTRKRLPWIGDRWT